MKATPPGGRRDTEGGLAADDEPNRDCVLRQPAQVFARPIDRIAHPHALAVEPRVLLADEPIAALDPYHQLQVMEFFAKLATGERAAIVVLHDLTMAMRFCQRLILLNEGRVHADGPPREVLTPATLEAVYGVAAKFGEGGMDI